MRQFAYSVQDSVELALIDGSMKAKRAVKGLKKLFADENGDMSSDMITIGILAAAAVLIITGIATAMKEKGQEVQDLIGGANFE